MRVSGSFRDGLVTINFKRMKNKMSHFAVHIEKFLDTKGNLICGMQYDNSAR